MTQRRLSREEARQRTRQAILQTSRELFAEQGYRGASLEEIAETAGYSKGAVYSNWPSKEALFLELLDRERTGTDLGTPDGVEISPTGWALATLDFFLEAVHNPQTRAALAERYQQARSEVGASMGGGRPDPSFATWEELAAVAMALGSGFIIQTTIEPESIDQTLFGRIMQQLTTLASNPGFSEEPT